MMFYGAIVQITQFFLSYRNILIGAATNGFNFDDFLKYWEVVQHKGGYFYVRKCFSPSLKQHPHFQFLNESWDTHWIPGCQPQSSSPLFPEQVAIYSVIVTSVCFGQCFELIGHGLLLASLLLGKVIHISSWLRYI